MQRIRYYFAPPGASYYLEPNVFFPIEQTLQFQVTDGVGELTTEKRVNSTRTRPAGVGGSAADGTIADFAGLTPYTGPIPIEDVPDCRVPKSVRLTVPAWHLPPDLPHLILTPRTHVPHEQTMGLWSPAMATPKKFQSVGFYGQRPEAPKIGGFALGAVAKLLAPFEGKAGIYGEAIQKTPGPATPLIGLFAEHKDTPLDGGVGIYGESANFTFTAGSITPGATCSAAATLAFDTDYTFTVGSGANNWFKFVVAASTMYYVKITVSSGSYPSNTISTGPNCAALTTEFSDDPITHCHTFTKGSATNCFILIAGSLFGSTTYTVRVGAGSCPP